MFKAITDTLGIPASAPAGTTRMFFSPDLFDSATGKYPKDNPPDTITYPLLDGKFQYWDHAQSQQIGLTRLWPIGDSRRTSWYINETNVAAAAYSDADKAATNILDTTDAYRVVSGGGISSTMGNYDLISFLFNIEGDEGTYYKARYFAHIGWVLQGQAYRAVVEYDSSLYSWDFDFSLPSIGVVSNVNDVENGEYLTLDPGVSSEIITSPDVPTGTPNKPAGYSELTNIPAKDSDGVCTSSLASGIISSTIHKGQFKIGISARSTMSSRTTSSAQVDVFAIYAEVWSATLCWPDSDNANASVVYGSDRQKLSITELVKLTSDKFTDYIELGTNETVTFNFPAISSPVDSTSPMLYILCETQFSDSSDALRMGGTLKAADLYDSKPKALYPLPCSIVNPQVPNTLTLSLYNGSAKIYAVAAIL